MDGRQGGRRRQQREEEKRQGGRRGSRSSFIPLGPSGGFGANFAAKTSASEWRRRQQKKMQRAKQTIRLII